MNLGNPRAPLFVLAAIAVALLASGLHRLRAPSCDVRLNEICLSGEGDVGLVLQAAQVTRQLEDTRYDLTLQDGFERTYAVRVVRSDALGIPDEALPEGYARVKLRKWNGDSRGAYVITNPHSEVVTQICVDGWPWLRCVRSGRLTEVF